MSFEYSGSASLTETEVSHLRSSVPNEQYLLVAAPTATRLLLRFAGRPERGEWPEDIDVRFGESIRLAIHSGTHAERSDFVHYLEARLLEIGHRCRFEED